MRIAPAAFLLLTPALWPQMQPVKGIFEAAAIKLDPTADGSDAEISPGRLRAQMTLARYIAYAFDLKPFQVTGGPGWIDKDHYAIDAKLERSADAAPESNDGQIRAALQALLVERFGLKFHRQAREMPAYALTVAKSGPKLAAAEPMPEGGSGMNSHGSGAGRKLTATRAGMARLSAFLSRELATPVADETHLSGIYNFELEWTPDDLKTVASERQLPSLFTALEEQLGLKLQAQAKAPVEIFAVDGAERPAEN